jgi:hypothetical protein
MMRFPDRPVVLWTYQTFREKPSNSLANTAASGSSLFIPFSQPTRASERWSLRAIWGGDQGLGKDD